MTEHKAKNKSDDHPHSYNINRFTSFIKLSQFRKLKRIIPLLPKQNVTPHFYLLNVNYCSKI